MQIEERIKTAYKGDIIGRKIIFYELTDSTNDRVMEIGQSEQEGTVVVADSQERGRGRFKRSWISPPGVNLYFTVLLKPPFPPKDASIITLMAGVAVASAVMDSQGLNAQIKWPNDIVIAGKKAGGILTEMKTRSGGIDFAAVGVGLNVNMPADMLPEDIRLLSTSLKKEKGQTVDRVSLLGSILSGFEYWYKTLLNGRRKAVLDQWLKLDSTVGQNISVNTPAGLVTGVAEGINDNGELIIRMQAGDTKTISAGDVTILKRR